jgi:hypothetical protein
MRQQCYESAMTAKSLAQSLKTGAIAPLSIGLSLAVDISLIVTFVTELVRALPGLELHFLRGTGPEVAEFLKKGEVEVAVAGSLGEAWDRIEGWTLFTEPYVFAVGPENKLAQLTALEPSDLVNERLVFRTHCEHLPEILPFLEKTGHGKQAHTVSTDGDVGVLLKPNIGFAVLPRSSANLLGLKELTVHGFDVCRTVSAFAVAGRQRSTAASTFIKMLRAADWSHIEPVGLPANASKVA